MTEYDVIHRTTYEYEAPVVHAHHLAHLRPRRVAYQTVHRSEVSCHPSPRGIYSHVDYFGNDCDAIEVLERHDLFEIIARSRVDVERRPLSDVPPSTSPSWNEARVSFPFPDADFSAHEYACDSPLVRAHPLFRNYAGALFVEGRPLVEVVMELNQRIYEDFTYEPLATDVSTPLAQVMRERRGVCQDFAHVAIACLRSFDIPARYISGYLETVPPPGVTKLVGADASHAWVAVNIPGHGWLEFDPTNGLLPTDRHILLAWGRDFSDVTPLKGVVLGGGKHHVKVGVDVEPVTRSRRSLEAGSE